MFNKMKKIAFILFIIGLLASCNNLFENEIKKQEEPLAETTVSSNFNGDYYVSFNLQEAVSRTVMPEYSYTDCLFDLHGTRGDDTEVLLLNKVSYSELVSPKNVKVKTGTWTFTVDCFDENNKKILSGTSPAVNISTSSVTIQIPMTFIVGNDGCVEISLTFPKGTDIATVASVKAGLFNSPLAAADASCTELTPSPDGENLKVTFAKTNLESGLTKYVKFFIYSEKGVELGHYTEAVIIGDNLTSKKGVALTTLRAPNVLTLKLKTNGSTYTGSAKTSLVLKSFPEEEFSYPMTEQGSKDTYSAKIINGIKYILYDGDYNTKLIFIPTSNETSDGVVEYCSSFANATKVLKNEAKCSSGLGLIVSDSTITNIEDLSYQEGSHHAGADFYDAAIARTTDKISLNLENCTAITSLSWYSFYRMPMLLSVSYPTNLKSSPYINNSCLVAIFVNEGNKTIPSGFSPSAALEYLYLPSTLETLNCTGLGKCTQLKKIVIPESNAKYSTDGLVITSKDKKELYSWPSACGDIVIPEGITSIDSGVFGNNTRLVTVSLPSTLTKIGDNVFSGCQTLRSVIIPKGVTSIGNSAFSNCSNLKSMDIPKGVTSIGEAAFYGCSNLKSITIPEGVLSIEPRTFYECSSLESIELPSSITRIGFIDDRTMMSEYTVFGKCTSLRNVKFSENLEDIGIYAFSNCPNLKSIEIPSNVKTIWDYAFYNTGLISINIPDNVETIKDFAFSNSNQLKTVIIGSGINSIGNNPFISCSAIISMTVSAANTAYESKDNCIYTKDGKSIIYYNCNGKTEITIPEGIEVLGNHLFYYNKDITKVTFPSTLITIGECDFYYCEKITSVIIPDNVTVIGSGAFSNCSTLKNVTLSSKLTEIGSSAFFSCRALESIILPSTLKKIGHSVFQMTSIKEIRIPGAVENIGSHAFNIYGLERLYLEDGITKINGSFAFSVSTLKDVYLPKTLKSVTTYAFDEVNIQNVYYAGTSSDWSKIRIDSDNGNLKTATKHYNAVY